MTRRLGGALGALTLLMAITAACGDGSGATTTGPDGATTAGSEATGATTTLAPTPDASAPGETHGPGDRFVTSITSHGIGSIAVQVTLPEVPRYGDAAGVVVEVSTFFTRNDRFYQSADVGEVGLIHIAYLWPGTSDPSGAASDGVFDYGGEDSIEALADVVRYAAGDRADSDGRLLEQAITITPGEVGLYAFSHPGIAAVNVLALHGDGLDVAWFVGRENPTDDVTSAVEVGYWDADRRPVPNPRYAYPGSYSPTELLVDFGDARWDAAYTESGSPYVGRAYLDLDGDGTISGPDHVFGSRIPTMWDDRYHSVALTRALADTVTSWPEDLATLAEAEDAWGFRSSTGRYPDLRSTAPDLMVMTVFADRDHVQPALDKPHIHHAYDGFSRGAGLWVRLNPDRAYVESIAPELADAVPDNDANTEPGDWLGVRDWAYASRPGADVLVPLAAVAEMADRARFGVADTNLDAVIDG